MNDGLGTTMNGLFGTLRRTVRVALTIGGIAVAALAAPSALAAPPCAGFNDVDSAQPNCGYVEWIKNRNVTLGCAVGLYCPVDPVSRMQMAAFMKRLGDALTPVQLAMEAGPGAIDLDLPLVVCQTGMAVTAFPRTAYADATFAATAAADVSYAMDLVTSLDGGVTWVPMNANANRGSAPAAQWGSLSDIGAKDLAVGDNVLFGARVSRGGIASVVDLDASRCQLRVQVFSRSGTSTPF